MDHSGVRIVIPHRGLRDGKSRLAGVLSSDERAALNGFMLGRVGRAARAVVRDVVLVSPDPALAPVASSLGLRFARQVGGSGMNHALALASEDAMRDGIHTLAVISGDLPDLQPEDVRSLLHEAMRGDGRCATIAPDEAGTGTNALVLQPPDVIPFRFGVGSRNAHVRGAAALAIHLTVVDRPGLARDIDLPSDLAAYAAHTRTGRALTSSGRRALAPLSWLAAILSTPA